MKNNISKDMTNALMVWFDKHHREMPWRGSDDPYHIWVSEMMLQQTQVSTVEKYYSQWIERFPDVFTLAEAKLEEVLKVWEGLGYYTRARNFHKGAKYIAENAVSKEFPFPDNYDDWLRVPGVGPYTAAAVSSIAFKYPAGVVDGNVKRVMARLFCIDTNIAAQTYHRQIFKIINEGFYDHHPGWVNQAWMELGSLQCTQRPDCSTCPLKEHCCAFKKDKVKDFPLKIEKKKIPTRFGAAFIIKQGEKFLMVKRPDEGFLGGLWEYPGFTLKEPEHSYLERFCRKNKIEIINELKERAKHTYSHFHQELTIYNAELNGKWENSDWTEYKLVDEVEMNKLPKSKITINISKSDHHS
ncbi:MAG: A/G-specific adenine glycosylase [Candidatus Marinimicrobia bacterium]|nr:A/G-specific adenine glycosylase [Candidatus Neomarinimicrobiota bacterium]